jgi:hypothetical protein
VITPFLFDAVSLTAKIQKSSRKFLVQPVLPVFFHQYLAIGGEEDGGEILFIAIAKAVAAGQGGVSISVKVLAVFGPEKDSRVKRNWAGPAVGSGAGMVGREVGPGVRAGSCGEQPTRRVKAKRRGKMRFIKQNAFLYPHCSTAGRRMPETKGYRGGQGLPDKSVGL